MMRVPYKTGILSICVILASFSVEYLSLVVETSLTKALNTCWFFILVQTQPVESDANIFTTIITWSDRAAANIKPYFISMIYNYVIINKIIFIGFLHSI